MTSNRTAATGYVKSKRMARLLYLIRACEWRQGFFRSSSRGVRATKWLKVLTYAAYRELEALEGI